MKWSRLLLAASRISWQNGKAAASKFLAQQGLAAARLLVALTTLLGTMDLPYSPSDIQEIGYYQADIREEIESNFKDNH